MPPLLSILRQWGHWSSSPPAQRENTTADATSHRRCWSRYSSRPRGSRGAGHHSPPTQLGRHYRRRHQPQQVLTPPLLSILWQRGHWSSSPPAQLENTTADATSHRRCWSSRPCGSRSTGHHPRRRSGEDTPTDATSHRRLHRQIHHSAAPPSGQLPNKRTAAGISRSHLQSS